jgi:hypothetical protein
MEAILVEIFCKIFDPNLKKGLALEVELDFACSFLDESESNFFGHDWVLLLGSVVEFEDDFELEGEL